MQKASDKEVFFIDKVSFMTFYRLYYDAQYQGYKIVITSSLIVYTAL
jgi:hypothetical protein